MTATDTSPVSVASYFVNMYFSECLLSAQTHFLKQYHPGEFLASFSVKAAGGSGGEIFRQEFFRIEADSSFLSKKAGYPYGPACFDGIEGRR